MNIRIKNQVFDDSLKDPTSERFKSLAEKFEEDVSKKERNYQFNLHVKVGGFGFFAVNIPFLPMSETEDFFQLNLLTEFVSQKNL